MKPNTPPPAERQSNSNRPRLRHQLLRSYLSVAAVGLAALGLTFAATTVLSTDATRLAKVRGPAVHDSMQAMVGVQQSLTALRSWIVLGDPAYREQRVTAWRDQIEPAIAGLARLYQEDATSDDLRRLQLLRGSLQRLEQSQWWIEDIAQTPGNEPARVVKTQEVAPVADVIGDAITACIDIEKAQTTGDRHALLAAMADLRGFFTRSRTTLVRYVDRAYTTDPVEFASLLNVVFSQAEYLEGQKGLLTPEQKQLLDLIRTNLGAYDRLADKVFSHGESEQWNIARFRLETEAEPAAQEANHLLTQICEDSYRDMQKDASKVTHDARWVLGASAVLILGMIAVALVVSAGQARRIAEPVASLSWAASRMAEGELHEDVQTTCRNELGELTVAFNTMRRRLDQRTVELTATRDQLERQQRVLHTMIRTAPVAMIMIDARGMVVMMNHQAEAVFGYAEEEVRGREIETLVPERYRESHAEQREAYFANPGLYQTVSEREFSGLHKKGHEISLEIGLTLVETPEGTCVLSAISDITQRKQSEAAMIEACEQAEQASRAKSEFVANMSHEIRTPMNAIIGLTEIVLNTELDDLQGEYLKTVANSAESLLEIINDILDFSKIEAGKLELNTTDFDMRETVGDVLKSFALRAYEQGNELTCQFGKGAPDMVTGDLMRFRQVLVNLVGNAVKFTENGQVHVEVNLAGWVGDDHQTMLLEVTVEDEGLGIEPQHLEKIFGEFEQVDASSTRQHGGTGLGLAITKRIVELMGGRIDVKSEPGVGSIFRYTVELGRSDKPVRQPWRSVVHKMEGSRILVVDDNLVNLAVMRDMLSAYKTEIDTARSGPEALGLLNVANRRGEPYDVIVSDVNMPEMNGYALASKVRECAATYGTPIILLTSSGDSGEVQQIKRMDISARLLKPVKQSELFEAMVHALGLAEVIEQDSQVISVASLEHGSSQTDLSGLRVLLVEDSVPNQKLALALLAQVGCQTVVACDGREAVSAATAQDFDVVLMDVQMPVMDGFSATAAIREFDTAMGRHTPIVAMTAHALEGDRERCQEAGMDTYVSKPIRPDTMFAAIDEARRIAKSCPAEWTPLVPWSDLLEVVGGVDETLQEVTVAYSLELHEIADQFPAAAAAGDTTALSKAAHKAKSALKFFQQGEAARIAEELEQLSDEGDLEHAVEAEEQLLRLLERFLPTIDEHCEEQEALAGSGQN